MGSCCGRTSTQVDFHLRGLPSRPGNVFGAGAWISGRGPRSGPLRRPPRGVAAGAVLDTVADVAGDGLPSAAAESVGALPASRGKRAKEASKEFFTSALGLVCFADVENGLQRRLGLELGVEQ